jgi:hypothetical protein
MTGRDSLTGVAKRRSEMELAMQALERTAARPSGHADWADNLALQARRLQVALNNHIAEVEPPTALLDQITDQAPRLQRRVEGTRQHHIVLSGLIERLLESVAAAKTADPMPVDGLRDGVVEVLTDLTRHRQDGADLIYDAYAVDIGGY